MRAEVFETFRRILHEGLIEKRTQYVIEQLFAVRRTEFEEYPRMAPELDLVEDGDQITHTIELNKEIDKEEYLDVFHVDPNFEENEETWKKIKMAILGEDESSTSSASEGEDENGGSDDDDENNSDSEDSEEDEAAKEKSTFSLLKFDSHAQKCSSRTRPTRTPPISDAPYPVSTFPQ